MKQHLYRSFLATALLIFTSFSFAGGQSHGQSGSGSGSASSSNANSNSVSSAGSTSSASGGTATATNTANGGTANSAATQAFNPSNTNVFTSPSDTTSTVTTNGTVHQTVDGTQTIRNTPSMGAPQLTTSNDTCMGSTSGAASGTAIGISFGTTWTDQNCVMMKQAREFYNMGNPDAAMARQCDDAKAREALELTGTVCPQSMSAEERRARYGVNAHAAGEPRNPTLAMSNTLTMPTAQARSYADPKMVVGSPDMVAPNKPSDAALAANDPYIARRLNK